jgi:DnaJ-class molecular chaperone
LDTRRVIICEKCKGAGTQVREELVNYHRRDFACWTVTCQTCGGSGRILETTTVTLTPFVAVPADPTRR